MKEKKPITQLWKRAKEYVDKKDVEKAMPLLEMLIIKMSQLTLRGINEIEGIKVDLMKERCWQGIEVLGMLPEYNED